ncbi:galactose-1-phosphate uridylyltransferase [Clostridium arbusti]|uniref:galactose-1-phosphate uridylyltransferase n=1 Tax=Clostridium arbusti TaxID=1137848 RepID=UPI00028A32DA|nr:galactose-1-phosphate uridylyltransferase [Clostridium arbusti]
MPHMRINPISNEVVIMSENRSKRPSDFPADKQKIERITFKKDCPFCQENQHMTSKKIYENQGSNFVKVVENKYPAVFKKEEANSNIYGFHYVVIEGRDHNTRFFELTKEHISEIIKAYINISTNIYKSSFIKYVQIFKNNGREAGASLQHCHSQIIGINILPQKIEREIENCKKYYKDKNTCILCDILKEEIKDKKRIVYEGKEFVALCPYASTFKYEVQIIKRKHSSTILNLNEVEIMDLSNVMKNVTGMIYNVLGDISYNIYYNFVKEDNSYYHFYIEICPRTVKGAGFEISTGIMINTVFPEIAAEKLRQQNGENN